MTSRTNTPLSDFTLERYRLGELPSEAMEAITTAAQSDGLLARRIELLESATDDLRETGLLRSLESRVLAATAAPRPRRHLIPTMAAAAALVVMLVWLPTALNSDHPDIGRRAPSSGDRVKGEPASLAVYRQVSEGSEQLAEGAPTRQGDVIRVAYRTTTQTFGVILSIDGAGVVTRHLPADGADGGVAAALHPGEQTLLDSAYELDDAPRWERFFLITGDTAFAVPPVLEAARRAASGAADEPPGTLALPNGLDQVSFLLRKVR